jgi:uncharacterized phiE125 gp8 family phage protein
VRITNGECVLVDRIPYGESPKTLPVNFTLLKAHLELTHNADDTLVTGVGGYLEAATSEAESRGNVALIRQHRRQFIEADRLKGESFALIYSPVIEVLSIKYLDSDDVEQDYPSESYRVSHGQIYFKNDPPTRAEGPGTLWVEYECGYGDTPVDVDAQWQSIVMQLAYRRYELRGENPGTTPDAWERMMDRQIVIAGGSRRG